MSRRSDQRAVNESYMHELAPVVLPGYDIFGDAANRKAQMTGQQDFGFTFWDPDKKGPNYFAQARVVGVELSPIEKDVSVL